MALIVIDVRTPAEFEAGHIRGAVNLDIRDAGFHRRLMMLSPSDSYVVYCMGGHRAGRAADAMECLGLDATSYSMHGASLATGRPVVTDG